MKNEFIWSWIIATAMTLLLMALTFGAVTWLIWKLWCFVMPQMFPYASQNVQHPGFWLFTAALLLMCLLAWMVTPSSGE